MCSFEQTHPERLHRKTATTKVARCVTCTQIMYHATATEFLPIQRDNHRQPSAAAYLWDGSGCISDAAADQASARPSHVVHPRQARVQQTFNNKCALRAKRTHTPSTVNRLNKTSTLTQEVQCNNELYLTSNSASRQHSSVHTGTGGTLRFWSQVHQNELLLKLLGRCAALPGLTSSRSDTDESQHAHTRLAPERQRSRPKKPSNPLRQVMPQSVTLMRAMRRNSTVVFGIGAVCR